MEKQDKTQIGDMKIKAETTEITENRRNRQSEGSGERGAKTRMRMNDANMRILQQTRLFADFTEEEISELLAVLRGKLASYAKGSFLLREGARGVPSAIVLSGSVHIIKEDFWGNRAILSEIGPGEMFAETYACMPTEPLAVSTVAAENCICLFLDFSMILAVQARGKTESAAVQAVTKKNAAATESVSAGFLQETERRLLINLTQILAGKNLFLTKKIEHLAQRTTRQKLLSYLSDVQRRAGRAAFDIPFDRQELADFLAVDRSAMSAELSKLRREGVLEYRKNHFLLKLPQM